MKTLQQYLESQYDNQLRQLIDRQNYELEQVQKAGDINQMIQTLGKHSAELAEFRKSLPTASQPSQPREIEKNPFGIIKF